MPSKSDIISSLAKEARITAHLAAKLRPQDLAFRFTPSQRSTQELLEYLLAHAEGGVSFLLTGSREVGEKRRAAVKGIALAEVPAALAAQQAAVEQLLAPLSESEFATRRVRNGQGVELPLAEALFEGLVKQAVGYKTQLFLQAKASGVSQLATPDLWRGEEAKAKAG
jgi:hypothetical protein